MYRRQQAYVNSNSKAKAKVMKEIMCDRSTVEGLLKLVGDPKFQMTIRSSATNAPKLMPGIKDLELCMPRDVRDAPMRLVHLHKLLEWLHLEVYENMKDEDFVTFPYGQTTAETWRSTILLSWRWSLGKPDTLECDHSPMSGLQLKYMKMALLVAREANPDLKYVWIDWSCVPQYSASPMLEVARSKSAMLEVARSKTAMLEVARSKSAMLEVARSKSAMLEVARSKVRRQGGVFGSYMPSAVAWGGAESQTAMLEVARSKSAMLEVARSKVRRQGECVASLSCHLQSAMSEVARSKSAMLEVARSKSAMLEVARSKSAMLEVARSKSAMLEVARSKSAMLEVAISKSAMLEVARSKSAMLQVARSKSAMLEVARSKVGNGRCDASLPCHLQSAMLEVATSKSAMFEVARSKVYYARAQQMIVLPDIVELDSSVETLLRLVLESLCEDPLWADSEHAQMAAHVINAIISDGVHAKLQYFGRVWTLAERLARCSWDEELHYWLSLQLWMGMVIDALASSSEDQNGSAIYWAKLFSAEIRDNMDKVSAKLRLSLELGNYRKTGLISEVATLLVEAVKVWLSAKMNEVPSEQWLSRYLESEAIEIYQAWSKPDAIWSVLSYFSWKVYDDKRRSTTEGLSDALSVLCSIAGIVPETTTVWKYLEEEAASHEKLMGACKAGDSNTVVVLLNLHPSIVNSKDKAEALQLVGATK
eukprot:gene426-1824_t